MGTPGRGWGSFIRAMGGATADGPKAPPPQPSRLDALRARVRARLLEGSAGEPPHLGPHDPARRPLHLSPDAGRKTRPEEGLQLLLNSGKVPPVAVIILRAEPLHSLGETTEDRTGKAGTTERTVGRSLPQEASLQ